MKHLPRKRFGQNFLQSPHVIADIIQAFNPQKNESIVEIGPGQGALTAPLLEKLDALTAVEIDTDLHAYLQSLPGANAKLTLINADALTIDFSTFGNNNRIIGNLPYNISTPLIFHLLSSINTIQDMLFMLQKEVVDRLTASPGSKDYGRLSIMVQYCCESEHLFDVPPEVFYPPPKVNSAVVRLTPFKNSPYEKVEFGVLERVAAQAFGMRRKTIANNMKPMMNSRDIHGLGIDPGKRPECISIAEYVQIAKFISK